MARASARHQIQRRLTLASSLLALACADARTSEPEREREDADTELVPYDLRRVRPRDEPLATTFDREFQRASHDQKRVAVLFSADWCEPCRILDLELGNLHPRAAIADVRIFEFKEEEWQDAARMDEFDRLRSRFYPVLHSYPVFVLLAADGSAREEMKDAKARLEAEGLEPTIPTWFESTR